MRRRLPFGIALRTSRNSAIRLSALCSSSPTRADRTAVAIMSKQNSEILKTAPARSVVEIAARSNIAANNGKRKSIPKTPSKRSGTQIENRPTTTNINKISGLNFNRPVNRPDMTITSATIPMNTSYLEPLNNIGERIALTLSNFVP